MYIDDAGFPALKQALERRQRVRKETTERNKYAFHVTQIIQPVQIQKLWREHKDKVQIGVSGEIKALIGNLLHEELLPHLEGAEVEKRVECEIDGVKIGGSVDAYHPQKKLLLDLKTTSAWAYAHGLKKDYIRQTNIYAYMLEKMGHEVKGIYIQYLFTDWSPSRAGAENYPSKCAELVEVPRVPESKVEAFLREQIELLKGEKVPECTDEDRWEGRRCENYCNVSKWCEQYAKTK